MKYLPYLKSIFQIYQRNKISDLKVLIHVPISTFTYIQIYFRSSFEVEQLSQTINPKFFGKVIYLLDLRLSLNQPLATKRPFFKNLITYEQNRVTLAILINSLFFLLHFRDLQRLQVKHTRLLGFDENSFFCLCARSFSNLSSSWLSSTFVPSREDHAETTTTTKSTSGMKIDFIVPATSVFRHQPFLT